MVDQAGSGMTGFHQLMMVAAAEISTKRTDQFVLQQPLRAL